MLCNAPEVPDFRLNDARGTLPRPSVHRRLVQPLSNARDAIRDRRSARNTLPRLLRFVRGYFQTTSGATIHGSNNGSLALVGLSEESSQVKLPNVILLLLQRSRVFYMGYEGRNSGDRLNEVKNCQRLATE